MEYVWIFLGPIIFYAVYSSIINATFNSASNSIENDNNKYAIFNENIEKIPYDEKGSFNAKILKVRDANSNHITRIYLLIGFKKIPGRFTKLKVIQLDKDKNVINFKEEYIKTETIRYNENENKTLFYEYDPNTIPKFYTTTMDFFIEDWNITEYVQYEIIDPFKF